jgi:hypothetical protein
MTILEGAGAVWQSPYQTMSITFTLAYSSSVFLGADPEPAASFRHVLLEKAEERDGHDIFAPHAQGNMQRVWIHRHAAVTQVVGIAAFMDRAQLFFVLIQTQQSPEKIAFSFPKAGAY